VKRDAAFLFTAAGRERSNVNSPGCVQGQGGGASPPYTGTEAIYPARSSRETRAEPHGCVNATANTVELEPFFAFV